MNITESTPFDLKALAEKITASEVPESCREIDGLLKSLKPAGSLSSGGARPEQQKAAELLKEMIKAPSPDELLFMAEICCGRYHRIRRLGDWRVIMSDRAKELLERYYAETGSPEVRFILDNFGDFVDLCLKQLWERQRHDDFNLYVKDTPLSTSRDPDSSEWKK